MTVPDKNYGAASIRRSPDSPKHWLTLLKLWRIFIHIQYVNVLGGTYEYKIDIADG